MKKILYACLLLAGLLASTAPAQAQAIANLNFETWATRNGADAPANWRNSDDYLLALLQQLGYPGGYVLTGTVTKTTTAHGGTYAANLTTQNVSLLNQNFPGIVVMGSKLGPNGIGGAPYTTRPAQMQFYYQFSGPAADSATAIVYVTNTVAGQPNPIGVGTQILAPTAGSYALASLPIAYTSSAAPDSVRILFVSSNSRIKTVGASLKVDDVALVGTALATRADAALQEKLAIAPNPSPDGHFSLSAPDAPALASAAFTVLDMTGRVVRQQPALAVPSPRRELDLSGLPTGIYLLRLDSKDGALVRQLTIK